MSSSEILAKWPVSDLRDEVPSDLIIHRQSIVLGIDCHVIDKTTFHPSPIKGLTRLTCSSKAAYFVFHSDRAHLRIRKCLFTPLYSSTPFNSIKEEIPQFASGADTPWWMQLEQELDTQEIILDPSLQSLGADRNSNVILLPSSCQHFSITFFFDTKINDVPEGLYRSWQRPVWDSDSWEKEFGLPMRSEYSQPCVLATAFEQLFARRVFPCVDIPIHKTRFELTLALAKCPSHTDISAVSTMRSISEWSLRAGDERRSCVERLLFDPISTQRKEVQVIQFEVSPILSSYSVSFFVAAFEFIESPCKVVQCAIPSSFPNRLQVSEWTLKCATQIYKYIAERVFLDLPLATNGDFKLTLVPLRYQRGLALENHGCISFKEDFFFIHATTSIRHLLRVCRLVAHEIIHQWIGNSYTPEEVKEVWLKEGITRYAEYSILSGMFKKSKCLDDLLWISFIFDCKIEAIVEDLNRSPCTSSPSSPLRKKSSQISVTPSGRLSPWSHCGHDDSPRVLAGRSVCSLHPMRQLGNHPISLSYSVVRHDDILMLFDSLTYNKAAAILMMFERTISDTPTADPSEAFWIKCLRSCLNSDAVKLSRTFSAPQLFAYADDILRSSTALDNLTKIECINDSPTKSHNQKALPDFPTIKVLKRGSRVVTPTRPPPNPQDLITITNFTVADLLKPWLTQIAFPIVSWQVDGDGNLRISQVASAESQYGEDPTDKCIGMFSSNPPQIWTVPLVIVIMSEGVKFTQKFILNCDNLIISVNSSSSKCQLRVMDGTDGFGYFLFANECQSEDIFSTEVGRGGSVNCLWTFAARNLVAVLSNIGRRMRHRDNGDELTTITSTDLLKFYCIAKEFAPTKMSALILNHMMCLECQFIGCDCTALEMNENLLRPLMELGGQIYKREETNYPDFVSMSWVELMKFGLPLYDHSH